MATKKELVQLLREIQWSGQVDGDRPCCPICEATQFSMGVEQVAHYEGCRLAIAIGAPTDK